MLDTNDLPRELKCPADFHVVLENWAVERICKCHRCLICNLVILVNTDYMFSSSLQKNFSNKLRMTRQNNHKFQVAFCSLNDFFKPVTIHELRITIWCFKEQEITFSFVFLIKFFA